MAARGRAYRKRVYDAAADWVRESGGCCVCGYVSTEAVDAHHIDPSKKENTVAAMKNGTVERLLDELDRCVPMCANHHRMFHAESRNGCADWPLEDIIAKLKREHEAWVLEQAAAQERLPV